MLELTKLALNSPLYYILAFCYQLHSILILLYRHGNKYVGEWDGAEGQGEINYKDGTKYIGHWDWDYQDGGVKRHGLGTLYSPDGQVLNQGKWEEDKYLGKD